MSRRKASIPDTAPLLQELGKLASSPLEAIAGKLRKDLTDTEVSARASHTAVSDFVLLYDRIKEVVATLPSSFGQRFFFDAAMVQSLSESWSKVVKLPAMIIPKPGTDWAVCGTAISEGSENAQRLFLITIPGADDLADVDLRGYAFMCHELAHVVLFKSDPGILSGFEAELDKCLRRMRLSAAADKGSARSHAKGVVDQIEGLWRPTANQQNWVHELAIDLMAVWTAGPAYINAYLAAINDVSVRPYEMVQSHPPHAVRVQAMFQAARELQWPTEALTAQLTSWRQTSQPPNRYAGAAAEEIVVAGVNAAFSICEQLALPKCTSQQLRDVQALLSRKEVPSIGIDTILAASINASSPTYDDWEAEAIREMSTLIQ